MRHRKKIAKLNITSSHRRALMANLVKGLLEHEKITTTLAKAKLSGRMAEKMITLAKKGGLHAQRQAVDFLQDKKLVSKLFKEIGPRFTNRAGGYTRIYRIGLRKGDAASMAILELVGETFKDEDVAPKKPGTEKKEKMVQATITPEASDNEQSALVEDAESVTSEESIEDTPSVETPKEDTADEVIEGDAIEENADDVTDKKEESANSAEDNEKNIPEGNS